MENQLQFVLEALMKMKESAKNYDFLNKQIADVSESVQTLSKKFENMETSLQIEQKCKTDSKNNVSYGTIASYFISGLR